MRGARFCHSPATRHLCSFCSILWSTSVELGSAHEEGRLAQVQKDSLTGVVDDKVLWLEIPVSDALLVHVSYCVHDDSAVEHHVFWWQTWPWLHRNLRGPRIDCSCIERSRGLKFRSAGNLCFANLCTLRGVVFARGELLLGKGMTWPPIHPAAPMNDTSGVR